MATSSVSLRWSTPVTALAGLLALSMGFLAARMLPKPAVHSTVADSRQVAVTTDVKTGRAATDAEAGSWENRWKLVSAKPVCPSQTRDLAAMLEELARTDPKRAMAIALAEKNWLVRDELRNAVLRGWGATAPEAAADWALSQSLLGERMQCGRAVLTGAAENPEAALRVALRMCAADPTPAGDYGHALINALVDKMGSFDAAARFAIEAKMVDRQSFLLDSAFYQWSQHDPARALSELGKVTDPAMRNSVLKGVVAGWADSDAEKLANYAQAMPTGADRTSVFRVALPEWAKKDPEAALQWMTRADPDPDYDKGIAALAVSSTLINNKPEAAMDLTDNITDSADRKLMKSNVLFQWAERDPVGARKFVESIQNPEYREMLLDDWAAATRKDK